MRYTLEDLKDPKKANEFLQHYQVLLDKVEEYGVCSAEKKQLESEVSELKDIISNHALELENYCSQIEVLTSRLSELDNSDVEFSTSDLTSSMVFGSNDQLTTPMWAAVGLNL